MKKHRKPPRHPVDISEADGIRQLHFGSDWVQGAMRIARPWSLELEYTRDMMAGLLLRSTAGWPKKALLAGLGAGSLAKFLFRHCPDCRITVLEINPQVEFVARQYFRLPDDPRLDVRIGCAAEFMLAGGERYDLILSDAFDDDGLPALLDSEAYYLACRARLTDGGLFCANLLREKGFAASVDRIRQAFDGHSLALPTCSSGNTILIGRGDDAVDRSLAELAASADALRRATRLDLRPLVRRLADDHPDGLVRF